MIRTATGAVLTALLCCGFADAQTAARKPAFEVASVKPAPPDNSGDTRPRGGPGTNDPGQITFQRTWLWTLLAMAYGLDQFAPDQIQGPEWLRTEAYSIVAKIPPNTTKAQFNLMLQDLLAERFHLTLHHEPREFPVYRLLVAKGGPKMRPASSAEADAQVSLPAGPRMDKNGFPVLRPGARYSWATGIGFVHSTHKQTMAEFAAALGPFVNMSNGDGILAGDPPNAHIIDQTGLTGEFDFTLEFAGSAAPGEAKDSPYPTLFVALEKQLGLKLERGKATLDVLVVDHVEKVPTEN